MEKEKKKKKKKKRSLKKVCRHPMIMICSLYYKVHNRKPQENWHFNGSAYEFLQLNCAPPDCTPGMEMILRWREKILQKNY